MSARQIALRYLDAFATGDPDRIAACVTPDFVNEHASALGADCTGRDVYRERLPAFLGRFEGLRYDVVDTITEGDRVAVRYRMRAVYDDHAIGVPGVMLFEVRDGLVAHRTDVWDSMIFLRQIDAVTDVPQR